jgi:membrane protein
MADRNDAIANQLGELKQDLHDLLVTLTSDPKEQQRRERRWSVLYGALSAGATLAARKVAAKAYMRLTGEEPPPNAQPKGNGAAAFGSSMPAAAEPAPEDEPLLREREEAIRGMRLAPPRPRPSGEAPSRDGAAKAAEGPAMVEAEPTEPQPEREEPTLERVRVRDLSRKDWIAAFKRAGKETLEDNIPMIASALAYSSFFAIPSVLLVVTGLFTLIAGPDTIANLMQHFSNVMPAQATSLLNDSLQRLDQRPGTSIAITVVGLVLATWSVTGAMSSYMTALNLAYDRKDRRPFVKKRLTALVMSACIGGAVILLGALLILGPHVEGWVGNALGIQGVLSWVWWVAQWPVLVGGLLAAFSALYYLGPDIDHPRWRFLTPGALFAVVGWLAASGLFAVYTSMFSSYNKTWGSLSAVIVMLTWLWLTGLVLLFGAELNAELERSRELRRGEPAEVELQAPPRSGRL